MIDTSVTNTLYDLTFFPK